VVASLDELAPAPTVLLANEVLDALPVHRVWMTREGPREGYVALAADGSFVEQPGPLSPELVDLIPELEIGAKIEVDLAARDLLASLARSTTRCFAVFLDYGTSGSPGDTLRGFREHRVTPWLESPGEQDVTADVDFALIARFAKEAGFDVVGPVSQSEFLGDLGLVDDLTSALSRGDTQAYLAGKGLLMPGGMGERFSAIALVRGVPVEPPIAGFRKDIYPGPSRR
jgi:SAM-dependent MidA family methyltransferase